MNKHHFQTIVEEFLHEVLTMPKAEEGIPVSQRKTDRNVRRYLAVADATANRTALDPLGQIKHKIGIKAAGALMHNRLESALSADAKDLQLKQGYFGGHAGKLEDLAAQQRFDKLVGQSEYKGLKREHSRLKQVEKEKRQSKYEQTPLKDFDF